MYVQTISVIQLLDSEQNGHIFPSVKAIYTNTYVNNY
jgi:hypothetical protein